MDTNRLGTVRKSLRQWQTKHAKGKGHIIPEKIRAKVVELLGEHSVDEVAGALGLNRSTVRRWDKDTIQGKAVRPNKSPDFIEVKGISENHLSELALEWIRRDGNRMRLTGLNKPCSREFINEFLSSGESR